MLSEQHDVRGHPEFSRQMRPTDVPRKDCRSRCGLALVVVEVCSPTVEAILGTGFASFSSLLSLNQPSDHTCDSLVSAMSSTLLGALRLDSERIQTLEVETC